MPPGTLRRGERDVTQWVLERAWQSAGTTDDNRATEGNCGEAADANRSFDCRIAEGERKD